MLERKSKKEEIQLDTDVADEMLKNIMSTCELPKASVSLEFIDKLDNYKHQNFTIQKIIALTVVIVLLLCPLLFFKPEISLQTPVDTAAATGIFTFEIDSLLPVKKVSAFLNGTSLKVSSVGENTYSINPTGDGTVTITVTAINNQQISQSIDFERSDVTSPYLISHTDDGEYIYLEAADDGSGINYDEITALTTDGNVLSYIECDREKGIITYPYPSFDFNVYIPDYSGNTLQLIITADK